MASRREQIMVAVVALLDAVGKPTGLNVHRSRALPIAQDKLPAMVVYIATEGNERKGGRWGPRYRPGLRIRVECRQEGNPPDQQLDPLTVWAQKQLVGSQTLGGLSKSIEYLEGQWDAQAGNKVYGAVALDFLLEYETKAVDPEATP